MLYDNKGRRKYLTLAERDRFIDAARRKSHPIETLCLTLAYTGARISEVLSIRLESIDAEAGVIILECLKKRKRGVFRQIPVPAGLLAQITADHRRTALDLQERLWAMSRTTAWKIVKNVMSEVGVPASCSSPKALRHSFGVIGIAEAQVPLNMMKKWLGHSRIETTAIYADAMGVEERKIAQRMWINNYK